jgi:hypothetical protein
MLLDRPGRKLFKIARSVRISSESKIVPLVPAPNQFPFNEKSISLNPGEPKSDFQQAIGATPAPNSREAHNVSKTLGPD